MGASKLQYSSNHNKIWRNKKKTNYNSNTNKSRNTYKMHGNNKRKIRSHNENTTHKPRTIITRSKSHSNYLKKCNLKTHNVFSEQSEQSEDSEPTNQIQNSNMTDNAKYDVISQSDIEKDLMSTILDSLKGFHHCRICDQRFNTHCKQPFIPQWISHRASKKHQSKKQELLKHLENGKSKVCRNAEVKEFDSECQSSNDDNKAESSEGNDDKHIVQISCPHCNAANRISDSQTNAQTKINSHKHDVECSSVQCKKRFYFQIKDDKVYAINKYAPRSLSLSRKRKIFDTDSDDNNESNEFENNITKLPPPKKKRRLQNNEEKDENNIGSLKKIIAKDHLYYHECSDASFYIPFENSNLSERNVNTENNVNSENYVNYHRSFSAKMTHFEMIEPCSRCLCSDFVPGDAHCWQTLPTTLPGDIRMAQIGYIFECVWCAKSVCFVESEQQTTLDDMSICDAVIVNTSNMKQEKEETQDNTGNNDINEEPSIERQCRALYNAICYKWKQNENMPIYSNDHPSYSRVPSSLNDLRIRDRIMASDSHSWLPGWIEQIQENAKVLIHFKGWNSRWDKWYNIDSGHLKTINEYRKENKLNAATRNEEIYEIMKNKYNLIATSLFETRINRKKRNIRKKRKRYKEKEELDDCTAENESDNEFKIDESEIVMMHDKNEDFMTIHDIGCFNENNMILCPPLLFKSWSQTKLNESYIDIVRKVFVHFSVVLSDDNDIIRLYTACECKLEVLLLTLHILKLPQRVKRYLDLLLKDM